MCSRTDDYLSKKRVIDDPITNIKYCCIIYRKLQAPIYLCKRFFYTILMNYIIIDGDISYQKSLTSSNLYFAEQTMYTLTLISNAPWIHLAISRRNIIQLLRNSPVIQIKVFYVILRVFQIHTHTHFWKNTVFRT